MRPSSAVVCADGSGRQRQVADGLRERLETRHSPTPTASIKIAELRMNVLRITFSPTTYTACPSPVGTRTVSLTTCRMLFTYLASMAFALGRKSGCGMALRMILYVSQLF